MKLVSIAAAIMLLFGVSTAQAQSGAPTLADVNADACGVFATASKMLGFLTDTKTANYYDLRTTIVSFRGWAVVLREHKPGAKLLTYIAKIEGLANAADQGAKVMLAKLPPSGKITVGDFKGPMTTIVEAFKTVSEDPLYDGCGKSTEKRIPTATATSTVSSNTSPKISSAIGKAIKLGDYTVTLTNLESDLTYRSTKPATENRLIAVELLIESGADQGVYVNPFYGHIHDADGYVYDAMIAKEPSLPNEDNLKSGRKARGWITIEVPKTAKGLLFVYKPPSSGDELRFEFDLGDLATSGSALDQIPIGSTPNDTPRPTARPARRPSRPTATVPPVAAIQPTQASIAQPTVRPDDPTKVPQSQSSPAQPPTQPTSAPPPSATEAPPPPKLEPTTAPSP